MSRARILRGRTTGSPRSSLRRGPWIPLAVALLVAGCGVSSHNSPSGPTPVVGGGVAGLVHVTVSPARLRAGDAATVTTLVQTGTGAPLPGRTVVLTATLGAIAPATGPTDEDGLLIGTLRTGAIDGGPGTVSATADGITATATVCVVTDSTPC